MPRYKHGLSNTRLHAIWRHMQTRCMNKNSSDFEGYGGRGIKICDEWLGKDGFMHFYNWAITNGYAEDLSIDRINNDGDYEPSNCRWVTNEIQQRNKRNNVYLTYGGKTMTCAEWSRELGLYVGTVNNRLHKGYTTEECLFGRKSTAHKIPKKYRKDDVNPNRDDCCNLRR